MEIFINFFIFGQVLLKLYNFWQIFIKNFQIGMLIVDPRTSAKLGPQTWLLFYTYNI